MYRYYIFFTISRDLKDCTRNYDLKVFKKGKKQGINLVEEQQALTCNITYVFYASPPFEKSLLGGVIGQMNDLVLGTFSQFTLKLIPYFLIFMSEFFIQL